MVTENTNITSIESILREYNGQVLTVGIQDKDGDVYESEMPVKGDGFENLDKSAEIVGISYNGKVLYRTIQN